MYQRESTYIMTTKEGMPRTLKSTCMAIFFSLDPRLTIHFISSAWWGGSNPDLGDRIDASMPIYINEEISKRTTQEIADADK